MVSPGAMIGYSIALSVCVQLLFFTIAYTRSTDKVTDASYSLNFVLIALITLLVEESFCARQVLLCVMVSVWGLRLGTYLIIRIHHMGTDPRFDTIRSNPKLLVLFWIVQCCTVIIVSMPLVYTESSAGCDPYSLIWSDFLGAVLWFLGLTIESVADWQKFQFKLDNPDDFMKSGLFKYSRHPNYFGECIVWIGVFFVCASALHGVWWLLVLGPIYIIFLLVWGAGIPALEARADAKYGNRSEYNEYKNRTNKFCLWFPSCPCCTLESSETYQEL